MFDLETYRVASPYEAPISTISIITTKPYKLYQWREDEIDEAVEFLLACPGYVTFNGRKFDVPALLKHMSRGEGRLLRSKPHFDIFHELQQVHPGLRISLNNFAKTTLGIPKFDLTTATAISLWKDNPRKLDIYNMWDTWLTYQLYVYCCSFGELKFTYPTERSFTPETISRTS